MTYSACVLNVARGLNMKNRIETNGRTPLIFYFALALPPLITYLEYQLTGQSLFSLAFKYGICFLFYVFCIDLINKQKFILADNKLQLRVASHFFNIEKSIRFDQVCSIKDHPFLPFIKVIQHGHKKTLIVNFYKNKNLFQEIKSERPDLF